MERPPALLVASLLLSASLPGAAVPGATTLTLVNDGVHNKVTVGVGVPFIGTDTDVSTLSGTLEVVLDFDPDTGEVTELTFTGGALSGTGISLVSPSSPFGSYNLSSGVLGATVYTTVPPGAVLNPSTGEFDSSLHTFELNSGEITGTVTVLGTTSPVSVDLGAEPVAQPGVGSGFVTVEATGSPGTYLVTVTLPQDIDQDYSVEASPGTFVDVNFTGVGTLKATGEVTVEVLSPYVAWTIANGIEGSAFDGDHNDDGIGNGILWALGLQAADSPFPYLPVAFGSSPVLASLALPDGGSAGELLVETSTSFQELDWSPLAGEAISGGMNPIPAGTSGTVEITIPPGDAVRGIRLKATEP